MLVLTLPFNLKKHALLQVLTIVLALAPLPSNGAEEEFTVLTITGNLIDKIDSVTEGSPPLQTITAYYQLLSEQNRENLLQLKGKLDRRVADYNVAYTAADTAEINEIYDELSFNWAAIRTLHAQEFTEAAITVLNAAYSELYFFIDPLAAR